MIENIYLCLNPQKDNAESIAKKIQKNAKKYSLSFVDDPKESDCVITIGGDGTYLFGTRLALEHNIALAGINLGRFGFLPSFPPDNVDIVLKALNSTEPYKRCVLDIDTSLGKYNAINEVVIERRRVERAARIQMISSPPVFGTLQREIIETEINDRKTVLQKQMKSVIDEYSTVNRENKKEKQAPTYVCDGVIIATPLGSTAYSSSVGGPAISPYSNAMSVTLSALHHPRIPPVVLTNNENIYLSAEEESVVVVDGLHVADIPGGEPLRICIGTKIIHVYERPASVLARLSHAFGADHIV